MDTFFLNGLIFGNNALCIHCHSVFKLNSLLENNFILITNTIRILIPSSKDFWPHFSIHHAIVTAIATSRLNHTIAYRIHSQPPRLNSQRQKFRSYDHIETGTFYTPTRILLSFSPALSCWLSSFISCMKVCCVFSLCFFFLPFFSSSSLKCAHWKVNPDVFALLQSVFLVISLFIHCHILLLMIFDHFFFSFMHTKCSIYIAFRLIGCLNSRILNIKNEMRSSLKVDLIKNWFVKGGKNIWWNCGFSVKSLKWLRSVCVFVTKFCSANPR